MAKDVRNAAYVDADRRQDAACVEPEHQPLVAGPALRNVPRTHDFCHSLSRENSRDRIQLPRAAVGDLSERRSAPSSAVAASIRSLFLHGIHGCAAISGYRSLDLADASRGAQLDSIRSGHRARLL